MIDLHDTACVIHSNAIEKDFWQSDAEVRDSNLSEDAKLTISSQIIGCKIGEMHEELSEAMSGLKMGNIQYSKPRDGSVAEEFADVIIRMLDLCYVLGISNLEEVIKDKMAYNKTRISKHAKQF